MILNQKINVLLIEDEEYDVKRVQRTLAPFKDKILIQNIVADGESAIDAMQKNPDSFDVIIMDYQIAGGISGEPLIRKMKEINSSVQIIVVTKMTVNITDFEFANRLIEAGAMWYCTKYPGDIEDFIYQPTDFILSILNAYEKMQLENDKRQSNFKLKRSIQDSLNKKIMVGESGHMVNLRKQIEKAAQQDATVMIYGASGTGKELVATHIHYLSHRRFENFVIINSANLPQELIESELFGYEKGSFTGALTKKIGLFEYADQGSIFLDEIGELPSSAQSKLLRVLQDGEIDKIGRTEKYKVDTRIIAATNKNLQEEINEKRFREDLFYRLNVVTIHVPDLKERQEDIPLLVDHFLAKYSDELNIKRPDLCENALTYMVDYDWPGNVRQLQNVLQRALFMVEDKIVTTDVENAIGHKRRNAAAAATGWSTEPILPWREMEKNIKRDYFEFVRDKSGSDAEAARKLGLAPPNYYRMCKELGMK